MNQNVNSSSLLIKEISLLNQICNDKMWAEIIDTPLGFMICLHDDESVYLLDFIDSIGLMRHVKTILGQKSARVIFESHRISVLLRLELEQYFSGQLKSFQSQITTTGTLFQKQVWEGLQHLPFGQTRSYSEQAFCLGAAGLVRPTASACAQNKILILIPCHRIVHKNKKLSGYAAGIERKAWLLAHEAKYV